MFWYCSWVLSALINWVFYYYMHKSNFFHMDRNITDTIFRTTAFLFGINAILYLMILTFKKSKSFDNLGSNISWYNIEHLICMISFSFLISGFFGMFNLLSTNENSF